MTDDKDALEELKRMTRDGPGYMDILDAAVAAWGEERASFRQLATDNQALELALAEHTALRAAVKKVRDELRRLSEANKRFGWSPSGPQVEMGKLADALDAALREDVIAFTNRFHLGEIHGRKRGAALREPQG